mmetsp:Transcript_3350/g.7395  ORF Transcript_3350/g.7395 Transcript_3350/m.7395 type:complete len:202 (-) Transcript_3350:1502-2107(-)
MLRYQLQSIATRGLKRQYQHHQYHPISTVAAKSMLGFSEVCKPSIQELRHAYFEAAKRCHPDIVNQTSQENDDADEDVDANAKIFISLTEAYEHLMNNKDEIQYNNKSEMNNMGISISEEQQYRDACQMILGIPAEIVEESKANPMFRQWLMGKTDAALHWKMFLAAHGGLAVKLRPPAGYLGGGKEREVKKSETRRRRKR